MFSNDLVFSSLASMDERDHDAKIFTNFIRDLYVQRSNITKSFTYIDHDIFLISKGYDFCSPIIELQQRAEINDWMIGKVIIITEVKGDVTFKVIEELMGPISEGLDIYDYLYEKYKNSKEI